MYNVYTWNSVSVKKQFVGCSSGLDVNNIFQIEQYLKRDRNKKKKSAFLWNTN